MGDLDENVDYTVEGEKEQSNKTEIGDDGKSSFEKEAKFKLVTIEHTKYHVENSTTYPKGKKSVTLKNELLSTQKVTMDGASHSGTVNKQFLSAILNVNKTTSGSALSIQKGGLNLRKGITAAARSFNLNQPALNDLSSLGSVEAQTSINDTDCHYLKSGISDQPAPSHILLDESEAGQEQASEIVAEASGDCSEPEPEEPEFDYFGCETCKADRKPVDKLKVTLSHKCPICPCACFCAHLLKEHMKVIHGWFNVQRKFTTY